MQSLGAVSGSLLFIEVVSEEGIFKTLGFTVPIMSTSMFIKIISVFTFISSILIHFKYNEKSISVLTKKQKKKKSSTIPSGKSFNTINIS